MTDNETQYKFVAVTRVSLTEAVYLYFAPLISAYEWLRQLIHSKRPPTSETKDQATRELARLVFSTSLMLVVVLGITNLAVLRYRSASPFPMTTWLPFSALKEVAVLIVLCIAALVSNRIARSGR